MRKHSELRNTISRFLSKMLLMIVSQFSNCPILYSLVSQSHQNGSSDSHGNPKQAKALPFMGRAEYGSVLPRRNVSCAGTGAQRAQQLPGSGSIVCSSC